MTLCKKGGDVRKMSNFECIIKSDILLGEGGWTIGVQFGEYFQSVLADSGIGYYPILMIILHFCHKN